MSIERCSVSRITHCNQRFSPGQKIYAAILGVDREARRISLTHRELLGTWAENAARFAPGMTVTGWVRGVKPYGTFVELAPNLTGLADQTEGLAEDDRVSVYIKAIQPGRRKIKLTVLEKLAGGGQPAPFSYFVSSGQLTGWDYTALVSRPL